MDEAEGLVERMLSRISELGLVEHRVSLAISGHAYAIRDIKRGRMPRGSLLEKLAAELKTTSEWLQHGTGEREAPAAIPDGHAISPMLAADGRPYNPMMQAPKTVPVYTGALGTAFNFDNDVPVEAQVMDLGEVVDMVRCPPGVSGVRGLYALYIVGESQSPRFDHGELVFVHPLRPVSPGDDVVVQLVDNDDSVVCALVKRLVRRSASEVTLRQFNPDTTFTVPQSRIRAIHKVLNNAELWGI